MKSFFCHCRWYGNCISNCNCMVIASIFTMVIVIQTVMHYKCIWKFTWNWNGKLYCKYIFIAIYCLVISTQATLAPTINYCFLTVWVFHFFEDFSLAVCFCINLALLRLLHAPAHCQFPASLHCFFLFLFPLRLLLMLHLIHCAFVAFNILLLFHLLV